LGVALFVAGGALRIGPVFVLGSATNTRPTARAPPA